MNTIDFYGADWCLDCQSAKAYLKGKKDFIPNTENIKGLIELNKRSFIIIIGLDETNIIRRF